MANLPTAAQKAGATPAKLALIGVLAVVLIAVLYIQFGGSDETAPTASAKPAVRRRSVAARKPNVNETKSVDGANTNVGFDTTDYDRWKPPELSAVVGHDPFARPASFPQFQSIGQEAALAGVSDPASDASAAAERMETKIQQSREELEALRQTGVQVVIRQDEGYVAVIGDRTIHVGDEINGFTVIAIDASGVRVARELQP